MNDSLFGTLLELCSRLREKNVRVLLGGGYGLFLKQNFLLHQNDRRTLIPIEAWPRPRTTTDLDLFVPRELLISVSGMKSFRQTIDELQFEPIEGSKFWQFINSTDVKIDVMTGAIEDSDRALLKSDSRRARPKTTENEKVELHARLTPEALSLDSHTETIPLAGTTEAIVIPSPFTYLMMKLTAFDDSVNEPDKDLGRHHALDTYRILAMLTEERFAQTEQQFREHKQFPEVERVGKIVQTHFAEPTSTGMLRMREHDFFGENMNIPEFIASLHELTRTALE